MAMAKRTSLFFSFACFTICAAAAINVDFTIKPDRISELVTDKIELTCHPKGLAAKHILIMKITRDGAKKPLATVKKDVHLPEEKDPSGATILVDSHVDDEADKSYLKVTMTKHLHTVSGDYTCSVIYLDTVGDIKQVHAQAKLTVFRTDIKTIQREINTLRDTVNSLVDHDAEREKHMKQWEDAMRKKMNDLTQSKFNADDIVKQLFARLDKRLELVEKDYETSVENLKTSIEKDDVERHKKLKCNVVKVFDREYVCED